MMGETSDRVSSVTSGNFSSREILWQDKQSGVRWPNKNRTVNGDAAKVAILMMKVFLCFLYQAERTAAG